MATLGSEKRPAELRVKSLARAEEIVDYASTAHGDPRACAGRALQVMQRDSQDENGQ